MIIRIERCYGFVIRIASRDMDLRRSARGKGAIAQTPRSRWNEGPRNHLEATTGFEPVNGGFADLCLTTWLRRHQAHCSIGLRSRQTTFGLSGCRLLARVR